MKLLSSRYFGHLKSLIGMSPQGLPTTHYRQTWDDRIEAFPLRHSGNKRPNAYIAGNSLLDVSEYFLDLPCRRYIREFRPSFARSFSEICFRLFASKALHLQIPHNYFFLMFPLEQTQIKIIMVHNGKEVLTHPISCSFLCFHRYHG